MPDGRQRPSLSLPSPVARRAIVVGAGSFGTAVAVLLARGGLRTTLQTRTAEQARRLQEDRENLVYLPGVEFPRELRIESVDAGLGRADYVFLGVPSDGLGETIRGLTKSGLRRAHARSSRWPRGSTPPDGTAPTVLLRERFGEARVACVGGPAHAREMVSEGAGARRGLDERGARATRSPASSSARASSASAPTTRSASSSPAPRRTPPASPPGATEAQGLNAAGAAAGHIFAEVWRYAEAQGARPESMLGLAGTGDLVATVLAPQSRNRRAGELLAAGVPAAEIPERIGQAVEALDVGPAAGARAAQRRPRGDGHRRPRAAHLRRAAARRVDRARAHDGPAAGALAPAPAAGLLGAGCGARLRGVSRSASVVTTAS